MRFCVALIACLAIAGCAQNGQLGQWLDFGSAVARNAGLGQQADATAAIREALTLGSRRAGDSLAQSGSFTGDTRWHIPLPPALEPVEKTMRTLGYGERIDQLERRINLAAEQAAGEAAPIFARAVSEMTVQDAMQIVNGGDTAATEYFREQTAAELRRTFQPIVRAQLEKTGFYSQYRGFLDVYDAMPMTDKPNLDIEDYAMDRTLAALFTRLGEEEQLIRDAPLERGSELIRAVFGQG
jgi:hypothetical protein